MKVCVLLSGGMDSVTAFYDALLHHEVVGCLSFDYGAKHNHSEIPFARLHSERNGVPHHTISLGFMNELFKSDLLQSGGEIPEGHYAENTMKKTVVTFRNGIMLAIATGYPNSSAWSWSRQAPRTFSARVCLSFLGVRIATRSARLAA